MGGFGNHGGNSGGEIANPLNNGIRKKKEPEMLESSSDANGLPVMKDNAVQYT